MVFGSVDTSLWPHVQDASETLWNKMKGGGGDGGREEDKREGEGGRK